MLFATINEFIIIIDQYTPTLRIISEEYSGDNVTVTVGWTQQIGAAYTARVMPLVSFMVSGSIIHQLTLSYDTDYNLSVVAVTPCGNAISFIVLDYGEIGNVHT